MRSLRFILLSLLVFSSALTARAADAPNVTAILIESETAVGRPVQLQIEVTGASNPKPPGEISVDGLEIRSAGVSRQYQMNNFSVSYSFTYNYTVMPLKTGAFKIPPQTIEVGGKSLRTPELTLNVGSASGQSGRSGRNGGRDAGNIDPAQIGFIELLLPKAIAYVGEMVPAQVRFGLNVRMPVERLSGDGLQIAGQGFTTQPISQPRQTEEVLNGRTYLVRIYNSAVAAARTGKIEVGPASVTPIVRVPRAGRNNPSLPRDLFDDPFFNNFFNDPAFAPSMLKEIPLKSDPSTLEVKPLPPNAPAGFSGAVGTFSLKVEVNPKKAQVGDPVTVTATIIGRGNFDRVTAPALEDENGWHTYPPSDSFKQDDDVGISGAKTFEMVVSAKERKTKLPPVVFTFFDPVKEQYVTLKSEEIALQIEGGVAPTATPASTAAGSSASAPPSAAPATPAPARQEQDILYQLTDLPATSQSFAPLYAQRSFWAAQLLPLLALLGIVAWKIRRARLDNRAAQRIARLQHEAAELQRALKRNDVSPQQYAANASRAVQLKTALARNLDPSQVDAETAAAAFHLDETQSTRLRQLFEESDEMRYSGGGNGKDAFSAERRREIQELVENLRV